jgi:hypothetical protein
MLLPEDLVKDYSDLKEYGDLAELMKLTGVISHSHMSKIMRGKINTTIENILKIKNFIKERKELIEDLNNNNPKLDL